jgi:RNA polymerase sigma factor (sigma-70 family)
MEHPMLTALCTERYGSLVAFATLIAGGRDGADDLVQEALVATFSKHRSFDTLAGAEKYVRAAIATKYLDTVRKESKALNSGKRLAVREPRVVEPATGESTYLLPLLAQLPPRTRACVGLRFLEDLSVRQTATLLGLSEGAVKRYVSDGLAHLNAALGYDATADDPPRQNVDVRSSGHE